MLVKHSARSAPVAGSVRTVCNSMCGIAGCKRTVTCDTDTVVETTGANLSIVKSIVPVALLPPAGAVGVSPPLAHSGVVEAGEVPGTNKLPSTSPTATTGGSGLTPGSPVGVVPSASSLASSKNASAGMSGRFMDSVVYTESTTAGVSTAAPSTAELYGSV